MAPVRSAVGRRLRVLATLALGVTLAGVALAGVAQPVRAVDQDVSIVDNAFKPTSVTVDAGDLVTWTNNGSNEHTVTADAGSFASEHLAKGDAFANVFDTPGTFAYHCTIHPTLMTGTVIVKAAVATSSPNGSVEPTPPSGTLPPSFATVPTPEPTSTGASTNPPATTPASSSTQLIAIGAIVLVLLAAGALLFVRRRR